MEVSLNSGEHFRKGEERLVDDFRKGDNLAFVALYNRYKRSVYAFCSKILMDQERAKDALQEVFMRVYEHREQLTDSTRFRPWLFAIARNQCLTFIRAAKHTSREEIEFDVDSLFSEATPEEVLEKKEEAELLSKFLAALKIEYREVLLLREFQGLSYREIAEVLGSTESGVKSRIFKARQRLFELLKPILRERG
jgi:RNA polymerase sigma-70 factor (ECF subfamily)